MIDFELEELHRCDDWHRLLGGYQSLLEQQVATAEAAEEFDGWLPRLQTVEGIDEDALSRIHGRLIAWGFLTFRLAGRTAGIQYQISPAGKQALARHAEPVGCFHTPGEPRRVLPDR